MLQAVALEAGLADLARQALSSDPEAAAQLKRYEEAVVRLEKAKAAEKELENIMKVCQVVCVLNNCWLHLHSSAMLILGVLPRTPRALPDTAASTPSTPPCILCSHICPAGRPGSSSRAGRSSSGQRTPACRPAACGG